MMSKALTIASGRKNYCPGSPPILGGAGGGKFSTTINNQ